MAGPYRVLLTRADNRTLQEPLQAAGVAVVAVPLIAMVPTGTPLPETRAGDWVAYSSVAGVAHAAALGVGPVGLAAVGPRTAAALAARVRAPDVVPAQAHAAALAAALGERVRGRRVWLPGPRGGRSGLRQALEILGAEPLEVAVYETICPAGAGAALARVGPVDAVVFASGSAVRHYLAVGGDPECPAVVIGPTTASVATALGVQVAATADPHTGAGLVAAVLALSRRPSG